MYLIKLLINKKKIMAFQRYIITEPIANVYKTNQDGTTSVVAELRKGTLMLGTPREQKTDSGSFPTLMYGNGQWIKKSSASLYTGTEGASKILTNEATNLNVRTAIDNAKSYTDTPNANTQIPTTAPKSNENIIIGVLAIGVLFVLLKWKEVI